MKQTSFGKMETLDLDGRTVEWLKMESKGTPHTHEDKREYGIVLSGEGRVFIRENETTFEYYKRHQDIFIIPPGMEHWMKPVSDKPFEFLIWYE